MIRELFRRHLSKVSSLFKPKPVSKRWPTKEEIAALPPFDAVQLPDIEEVTTASAAEAALLRLSRETVVGFDTESQPTFVKGQVSTGPHVVQLATPTRTYVFLLHDPECRRVVKDLLSLATLKKVGFGLDQDRRLIPRKLHIQPESLLDLESLFRQRGYGRGMGVKTAVAIIFGRKFSKSRSASTSNWSRHRLSPKQLLYAANDAYAALCVYQALTAKRP